VLVEGAEATSAILTGLVGSYGRITGAPAVLLFVGQTSDPGHMAAAGYIGQQAVLEATAVGLATCWVAGAFSRRQADRYADRYADLAAGEMILAVSPVGAPRESSGLRRWHDLSLKAMAGSTKRKPLEQIVTGAISADWLRQALEAARWAPSSVNGQPWRFTLEPGRVTVGYEPSLVKRSYVEDPKELDCGIAMANFTASARAHSVAGSWHYLGGARTMAEFRY
jgi:hypothetical protein